MGNSNNGKLISALLVGAAIGGALGILLAPDKGSETRKKISDKSTDLTGAVKDKFEKEVDAVKEQANEYAESGKSALENIKHS